MSLGISIVAQAALLLTGGETYAEAYQKTSTCQCPLVVIVGAEWCAACKVMKDRVIPEVRRNGILCKVAYAAVDLDEERELGTELTNGGPIPQLVVYRKTHSGWCVRRLVGGHSVQKVEEFIAESVAPERIAERTEGQGKSRQAKTALANAQTGSAVHESESTQAARE
jgi:thioredoxin-like negative regulator of GroEL